MTLVQCIATRDFISVIADRRLSSPGLNIPFLSTKLTKIDTTDGQALISYSGLGAKGISQNGEPMDEISSWLRRSCTGRLFDYFSLIDFITQISEKRILSSTHFFIVCCFVDGVAMISHISKFHGGQLQFSKIDEAGKIGLAPEHVYPSGSRFTAQTISVPKNARLITAFGSGDRHVTLRQKIQMLRYAIRLQSKSRRPGWLFSNNEVGVFGAYINRLVSEKECTVSPECVAISLASNGYGWWRAFDKNGKSSQDLLVPEVTVGIPVDDLIRASLPHILEFFDYADNAEAAGIEPDMNDVKKKLSEAASKIKIIPDDRF